MSDAHLLRKITNPALPPTMLHREALLARLNDVIVGPSSESAVSVSATRLVLLHAPAGYGKTTLLADYARQSRLPCCWYVLDRSDIDTITFLECLVASIRQRFPQFGVGLDPLLTAAIPIDVDQRSDGRLEIAIEALVKALTIEIPERFALILCNYHEVNENAEITSLLNQLLRLPATCVLVIESRAIPNLEFATLLAHREVFVISSDLLRLSTQEIRTLATLQGAAPLNTTDAEQLATSFEGWFAGILLGTRLGDVRFLQRRAGDTPLSLGTFGISVGHQHLFSYVVNEVFQHHPEAYAFLKDACILQMMTPSFCAALLEIPNATERLQYLEQQGLFVSRSGEGFQTTYTCHPVLRELLSEVLRRQSPERFVALHRHAMELWQAALDYDQAIYHALEAGLHAMAAHLILEIQEYVLAQGRMDTFARWVDALPPETIASYPKLFLVRARIYLLLGEATQVLSLLTTASEAIAQQPTLVDADELPLLQASISIARSKALCRLGEYAEAQQLCQHVIERLPMDEVKLRAEVYLPLATCAERQGDPATSIAYYQKALQLWGRNSETRSVAQVHYLLSSTYGRTGNFTLAEYHLSRAMRCYDHLQDKRGRVNALLTMGLNKYLQGDLLSAEASFQDALMMARGTIRLRREEAYALVDLGGLYQDSGRHEQSLAILEDGLALARQLSDKFLINYTLCMLAWTYLLIGDTDTAMLFVSEVQIDKSSEKSHRYERAYQEFTHGVILLYKRQYAEAYTCLTEVKVLFSTMGFKMELLSTLISIAACQLAQEQITGVVHSLEEVTATLSTYTGYEQLVLLELRRYPALEQIVKTLPELAQLRALLHLETGLQETPVHAQLASVHLYTEVHPSRPQLRILAFGEPVVLLDEKPMVRWRMARAMELFYFLLNGGRPLRKEQIITALWPEVDEQIDHTFHSTIYYLRKAFGESCITSQKGSYSLTLASLYGDQVRYDVATFQNEYSKAKQALAQQDDAAAKTALLAMIDLYRGDYVQPFYSDWCSFRRDELRTSYLDARRQLAQLTWRSEQLEECATHWQHMLAVDSCQEDAHYGLMRCYLRQGKRSLTLRQYQRCRDSLQQELGVQPGLAIKNLYQRLTQPPSR